MEGLKLKADKRTILGKKTRFLRRQNITPVHLFGHGLKSQALQCDTAELQHIISRAGATRLISLEIEEGKQPRSTFIREIQRAEPGGRLLHVDFYQMKKTEKMKVDIPLIMVGEAPAMKERGRILTHGVSALSIECLPDKIPPQIEVDLTPLEEMGQAIYVRDITLSPDITVFTDPDQMVVKVSETAREKAEEIVTGVEAEAEAEGEAAAAEEKAEE
ncbi:MAG: 50S ribosomal protein L25 [Chloroflexota bacterium]|nr:50S ribosomal protein L25 [Chloroflexota bacterium]